MVESFEDLEVWQMGKNIVMEVYQLTSHFPKEESFVLTSQIRRAALSVPANIAEGFGRYHYLDKAKFYLNARGSLYELKSHLLIAKQLGYLNLSQSVSINRNKSQSISTDFHESQPITTNFHESQPSTGLLNTIDKLGIKLNNLISNTRQLHKESQ